MGFLKMSPAKMLVAKVVSHRDLDRKVILALEEFARIEFIDVRRQAGIVDVKKSREEQTVYTIRDRLIRIIETLGIDRDRRMGERTEMDDANLEPTLRQVAEIIAAVEEEVLEIEKDIAGFSLELDHQCAIRDVAAALKPLGLDPRRLGATEFTFTIAGVIPTGNLSQLEWSLKEVTEDAYAFKSMPPKKGTSVCNLSVPVDRKDAVERILSALGFIAFDVPEGSEGRPEEIEKNAESRVAEIEQELERLEARRETIANEWGSRILGAWEQMEIEQSRIDVKSYFVYTEQSVKLWGWIPDGTQEDFEAILSARVGSALEVTFDHPDFSEHDSPTYLDNPSFMKPTEDVVCAYGVPDKHDLDPTKIQWLSFPLIFGLVFADVGQGFLVLLIGIAALRAKRRGDDWGQIMGYIQSGAHGLIMMGIFAMIGGFLFGSLFGAEVIEPLWPAFAHTIDGHHNPYRAAHMLKLSIEIGAIQIALGIFLKIYNELKHRDMKGAIVAISYFWLYIGFVNLLFGVSYNSIEAWFDPSGTVNLWIPIAGIGYGTGNNGVYPLLPITAMTFTLVAFLVPFIIMAVTSFTEGMDGVVHLLESAIGMISHTVSYARIFALNTVHIILSGVFFTLVPGIIDIPLPHIVLGGIEIIPEGMVLPLMGAIVGTFIVGILEGLLAFMHTLRLHMVEWYSKFYHAGGIAFRPFKAFRKHTVAVGLEPLPLNIAA
ncbi:MAG: V-type ATP synthase subunit I [Candidatus Thorarchaeota archaeon]